MDIIAKVTKNSNNKKDDWVFPMIIISKQSPYRIVLVDKVGAEHKVKVIIKGLSYQKER